MPPFLLLNDVIFGWIEYRRAIRQGRTEDIPGLRLIFCEDLTLLLQVVGTFLCAFLGLMVYSLTELSGILSEMALAWLTVLLIFVFLTVGFLIWRPKSEKFTTQLLLGFFSHNRKDSE